LERSESGVGYFTSDSTTLISGDRSCQVRGVDVEETGCQGGSLRDAILEKPKLAVFVVTGEKSESAIVNHLHYLADHELVR